MNNPFMTEPLHTLITWAACATVTGDDREARAYASSAAEVLWRLTPRAGNHPECCTYGCKHECAVCSNSTITRQEARAMVRGAVAAMVEIIIAD